MELDDAEEISRILLGANVAVRERLKKAEDARKAAARAAEPSGKTPGEIRSEFIQQGTLGTMKFLAQLADTYNSSQAEIRVGIQDLVDILKGAAMYFEKKIS